MTTTTATTATTAGSTATEHAPALARVAAATAARAAGLRLHQWISLTGCVHATTTWLLGLYTFINTEIWSCDWVTFVDVPTYCTVDAAW